MNKPKSINPENIFLIDGIGALISTFLLGFVLIKLQEWIGMPQHLLELLAALAFIFAIYSFSMHIFKPKNWQLFLRIIAYTNLTYCIITLYLIVAQFNSLTSLGITYFLVEIVVILALVKIEFQTIRTDNY
ncbi:hypothetical protein [Ekhidna sp.]|uniref:hypothetical protein n=1 Tax=Ekhidna sp. TaxID=2608089 RepID=UPI003B515408